MRSACMMPSCHKLLVSSQRNVSSRPSVDYATQVATRRTPLQRSCLHTCLLLGRGSSCPAIFQFLETAAAHRLCTRSSLSSNSNSSRSSNKCSRFSSSSSNSNTCSSTPLASSQAWWDGESWKRLVINSPLVATSMQARNHAHSFRQRLENMNALHAVLCMLHCLQLSCLPCPLHSPAAVVHLACTMAVKAAIGCPCSGQKFRQA